MGEAQAPRTVDAAERAQLIRVAVYFGPPCLIMVNALAFELNTISATSTLKGMEMAVVLETSNVATSDIPLIPG